MSVLRLQLVLPSSGHKNQLSSLKQEHGDQQGPRAKMSYKSLSTPELHAPLYFAYSQLLLCSIESGPRFAVYQLVCDNLTEVIY